MSGAEHCLLPEVDRVLRDEFPGIESGCRVILSVLAKSFDETQARCGFFMRPESHRGFALRAPCVRTRLVFVFSERPPSGIARDGRAAKNRERNFLSSVQGRPCGARIVLEYFNRAGIDLKRSMKCTCRACHIDDHIDARGHAVTGYTKRYLPEQ